MLMGTRANLRILPSSGRLHEWIAIEEGFYQAERVVPELLDHVMHQASGHESRPFRARPQDEPLLRNQLVVASASAPGAIYYAASGMGRVVPDVHGIATLGIFVPPESPVQRTEDFAGIPIEVGLFAGSHFATLQLLEARLRREQIVLSGGGGGLRRLTALLNREIPAAALQDPSASIALLLGMRQVVGVEYKRLFWVHKDLDPRSLAGYLRAMRRAEAARAKHPTLYRDLWARTLPADILDDVEFSDFGPGERLVFEPITRDEVASILEWLDRQDLDPPILERSFEKLTVRVPV